MRKLMAVLVAVGALAVPATASADPGNGAQHFADSQCYTYPDYGTFCYDWTNLVNQTENKNNISFMAHSQDRYSFTGSGPMAGCSDSSEGSSKYHMLFKKNTQEVQEQHQRYEYEYTFVCGIYNVNIHCTSEGAYHYANGQLQFNRYDSVCEPV